MGITALKGNQKTAYREVKKYFANEGRRKETLERGGGYFKETAFTPSQTITREYFITSDIKWFEDRKDWEKPTSIGYERKTTFDKETGETLAEERYYLCSIKPIAELFTVVARRHWHIENGLHWTLGIVFKEDKLRSKEKNGIHNLGLTRRFVMFIIKLLKAYYHKSMKRIWNKIRRNLESLLFLPS